MKKKKQNLARPTRRQFLGMMGSASLAHLAANPLQVLISSMVDGILAKSQAQAANISAPARNYVFLNLNGGSPRWVWDMPLTPYAAEALVPNAHVKTRFRSSTEAEYGTVAVTRGGVTLNMPHLWSSNIPTSNGGVVPMANLLDNMLMIRGVKMPSDGHTNNNFKQLRPVNSHVSLNGAVADRSRAAVPAVGLPGGYTDSYLSSKAIAQSVVDNFNDPIGRLLSPFKQNADGIGNEIPSMDAVINTAMNDLANQAKIALPGAENLYAMRSEAVNLLRRGIGDLSSVYSSLHSKYQNLISRAAQMKIAGVNDVAVALGSLPTNNGIIRQSIVNNGAMFLGAGADMRQLVNANTVVPGLAENFAIAEYLIVNGYSSAVNMGIGYVTGLSAQNAINIQNGAAAGGAGNVNAELSFDEHQCGSFTSLIGNSFLFSAISACLYEFISTLKAANLFNETVIQIGGEFSRSARNDHTGSDHGWAAHTTSVLSGAITKPMVLGNCLLTIPDWYPNGGSYPGSWGVAAPTKVDGVEQELTIGHSTSTVAHLLRVEAPLPNNGSLVAEGNGGVVATIEYARNINNT